MMHDPLEQVVQAVEQARQEKPAPPPRSKTKRPLVAGMIVLGILGLLTVAALVLAPKLVRRARVEPSPAMSAQTASATFTPTPTRQETVDAPVTAQVQPTTTPPVATLSETPSSPKKTTVLATRSTTSAAPSGEVIAERGVNVRARPSTEAERVGGLPKGTRVALLARNSDCTWYYVQGKVDNITVEGWVFARFVQVPKNTCIVLQEKQP